MKRISLALVVATAVVLAYALGRHHAATHDGSKTARQVLFYVDPMHPGYKSDKPGVAPDCGMALEPVYAGDSGSVVSPGRSAPLPPGAVSIDEARQRLLGIRLATVEKRDAAETLRVVGRVAPEDTRVYKINSGTVGIIRETFNDSVGVLVKKDQKLASYYAPDFLSVASGYLAATERLPGYPGKDGNRTMPFPGAVSKQGVSSLQGYADRLRNLGMSDAQLRAVAESRQLPEDIDVVAPADGFILARNITPGEHFDPSVEFYRMADLSRVWVVAEVYEQDAPNLRPGSPARITLHGEGRQWPARITDSLPQSDAGGGTAKLRLEVNNPGFVLRPDMLVDVELPVRLPPAVTIPLDALVDSGERARVYVEHGEGIFEPRGVETGWRSGERVEIRHGLEPGDRVVASATFLVDSESRLQAPSSEWAPAPAPPVAKPVGMSEHKTVAQMVKDPSCGMLVDPAEAAAAGNSFVYQGVTQYFCSRRCEETFQKSHPTPAGGARVGGR
jgi:Cu(I)/Ag(I) efflux system membrane fusion protein